MAILELLSPGKLLVVLLLVVGVMLANHYGKTIVSPATIVSEQGDPRYPYGDCGFNFFLTHVLPGDVCVSNVEDGEKVENKMDEIDPGIWERPYPETASIFDQVMYAALKAIGWDLP